MNLDRRRFALALAALGATPLAAAQTLDDDLVHAALLRERGLADTLAYSLIESLVTEVGARPAGSASNARAVQWALAQLRRLGFAKVRADEVSFSIWQRGAESAQLTAPYAHRLTLLGLGNTVPTPDGGIEAEVAWYPDLEALRSDTSERARGRIVVIDQKTERSRDGSGYGRAIGMRTGGAVEAARHGAVALVIRSLATDHDRFAHTGSMRYEPSVPRIPAAAMSVPDADLIARLHERGRPVSLRLALASRQVDARSHNVIAEVPGTDLAGEIVQLGAHLDSWDVGHGAVDDGAGIGIATAAAKLLLDSGRRPRRTVRLVLFANEENGFDGANGYAERYKDEPHQLVSESDFGAGRIWRLRSRVRPEALERIALIGRALAPLGIEPAGNDASPSPDAGVLMRRRQWPALELTQDGSDYFDVHHTENDTLDKVDAKALPQNVAAWAVAAWLAAQSDVRF
ncbi:MAG TPA: M20/M25/M40 family metallo-hydrolase [Albitalea sp.]|uniref:M20/M25/M40 family metallo-hydrolase n=1 Tax=Piscinibacter sp. TaxID=1903157 RepID=UPI002ED3B91B